MSGVGFSEFLILCLIGLIVLGPKRLPQVASQIGSWVGQARRMTRVMKRQLEEELNFDDDLNIKPKSPNASAPMSHPPPRDDDDYSPVHVQPEASDASAADSAGDTSDDVVKSDEDTNDNDPTDVGPTDSDDERPGKD